MVKNALVVEDTPANRDFVERLIKQAGFEVHGAANGITALEIIQREQTLSLAMIDMQLPDVNGLQLVYQLRQTHPETYVVVATMHDERALMQSVHQKGGNCFLVKPHGFMELFKRLTTMSLSDLMAEDFVVIDQYGPRTSSLV